jgi:glutamate-1-semialdehyde 2,1-aminomutase
MTRPAGQYRESVALYRRASAALAGGVSSNFRLGGTPAPLFFDHGRGAELVDVDGNRYVDYAAGMGPTILGHAPEAVVEAVREVLDKGQLFAGQTETEVALAELFIELVPCAERVRFGMSGSEMVHAATRVARAHTGRPRVVKFEGHYHGWLDPIYVNLTPDPDDDGPVRRTQPQSGGQILPDEGQLVVLPWNDADAVEAYLRDHGDSVAALIMEPILCNTSTIVPRDGYLEAVRRACDRHGVVLIFDEVITGFRVGPGGAQELLGVTPDLAVFAKSMGGGFPIAALAGRASMMDLTAGAVVHGGTFNSNLVSVTAALATLRRLASDGDRVYPELAARGERLIAGLRAAGAAYGLWVQGQPAVFNTTFGAGPIVDYPSYVRTDLDRQRRFLRELQDRGVRPTARGTWFLSAAHTDAHVDETIDAVADALAALEAGPRPAEPVAVRP